MKKLNLILVIALLVLAFCFQTKAEATDYSKKEYCLEKSYEYYKKNFIQDGGRIVDPKRKNLTTSEGQGYFLLRAVVMNDRESFDKVYSWTKKHLQRRDKLFSWLWSKNKKGYYHVTDYNSASDADVNIAFSLIIASLRWEDKKYLKEALPIVNSIWRLETKKVGKHRVLMPGVVQARFDKIEINPSYFSPYAFKFFKKYDRWHNWDELVDSSYYYIGEACSKTKTGLPPNWFLIKDGKVVLENSEKSDFSYDAIRVFKKIYMDYIRTGEKRALPILAKSKFFINNWKKSKNIYTNYKKDGIQRDFVEFVGAVVVLVPAMHLFDEKTADEIYDKKVRAYLLTEKNWKLTQDYYAKNLLWFGCYFYLKDTNQYKDMYGISKYLFK